MKPRPCTPRMRAYLRLFARYALKRQSPTYRQLRADLHTANPQPTLQALMLRGCLVRMDVGGHRRFVYYLTDKGREEAAYGLLVKARRKLGLEK